MAHGFTDYICLSYVEFEYAINELEILEAVLTKCLGPLKDHKV